jgi:hypothetical protein
VKGTNHEALHYAVFSILLLNTLRICNYHAFCISTIIFTASYNNSAQYNEVPFTFGFKCSYFSVQRHLKYAKISCELTYNGEVILTTWENLIQSAANSYLKPWHERKCKVHRRNT